jgi:dTMP kinase
VTEARLPVPSSRPGLFIVLEGGEGAGKTTQAQRLGAWMTELGVPFTAAREPGGTQVGEAIRDLLLERKALRMPAETELLLMLAARAAFVREVVRPALDRGRVMLADRFEYSTFVYQGIARGLGVDRAREMNRFATGGLSPDLVIVLDVPTDEGLERRRREGKGDDRIEAEGGAFMERVRAGYRELCGGDPKAELVRATGNPDEVHAAIRSLLMDRFPEPFGRAEG